MIVFARFPAEVGVSRQLFHAMSSSTKVTGEIDFYGRLSWSNFFDWLVTLCLGGFVAANCLLLGGVRPETTLLLLPLLIAALVFHGFWLLTERDGDLRRLSLIPLWFAPFVVYVLASAIWLTPYPWLGVQHAILFLQAFAVLWLLVNNLRTRAHLWTFLGIILVPVGVGIFLACYQFFQDPKAFATPGGEFTVVMAPVFYGQATGTFADPGSYATFALIVLPMFLVAAAAPRLPQILRVLFFYLGLMIVLTVLFAQVFWTVVVLFLAFAGAGWFVYKRLSRRLLAGSLLGLLMAGVALFLFLEVPRFRFAADASPTETLIRERAELWSASLEMVQKHPLLGVGAGAFPVVLAQSENVSLPWRAKTPENDYLWILAEYGVLGFALLAVPVLFVVFGAYRRWRKESYSVPRKEGRGRIMPPQRFIMSLGLGGMLTAIVGAFFHFILLVPALAFCAVIGLGILAKSAFQSGLRLPQMRWARLSYLGLALFAALGLFRFGWPPLQASAQTAFAQQRLEQLVERQVHKSGNTVLLDEVINRFRFALQAYPRHADAWIGLSAAYCQLFYRSPAEFDANAALALEAAERAVDLSEAYWRAWAQLGVAQAHAGDAGAAEKALARALALAPNSSNANYYWASFLSHVPERRQEALRAANRAIEINPENAAARRLQQKLRIL